jgi:hypothetical protein
MSKLGSLERPPVLVSKRTGPHNYRLRGGRVLITNDFGGWAFLSVAEYEEYLAGKLSSAHPRLRELARGGFLLSEFSMDAAAGELGGRGLLSWQGPGRHVVALDGRGRRMDPETARRVTDFIFSGPMGPLRIELAAENLDEAWPAAWFLVQYARRKSEWYGRPLGLTLRVSGRIDEKRREFLAGHGVALRALVRTDGCTPGSAAAPKADRGLVLAGPKADQAQGWADFAVSAGWKSARLQPAGYPASRDEADRFCRFYAQALDGILRHARSGSPLREEWAAAALSRFRGSIEGLDVLGELAYAADGKVYTNEDGLSQSNGVETPFVLGIAGSLRYADLASNVVVRGCLGAACGDNQPLCVQCVYKPFCAPAPSRHFDAQGSLWGRTPESLQCSLQMGLLDVLFERLADEADRKILEEWAVGN